MNIIAEIEKQYVNVSQIAEEFGVDQPVVHRWARYHRYFDFEYAHGKPLVKRTVYEQFKKSHPELRKAA